MSRSVHRLFCAAGVFFLLFSILPLHMHAGTLLMGAGGLFLLTSPRWLPKLKGGQKPMTFLIILGLVLLVFHFALWNYFAFGRKPPEDSTGGTVIVLGCKIHDERPSLMLRGRLDAALSYLNAHPESMCVVTGGQGKNETFTEAHTMALYLRESGIHPDRIREEGQARNTDENLKYSLEIIREQSLPGPYIICTDGFHQMRAFVYAQKYGAETFAISGRTPFWLVPAYALREIPALVKAFLFP